MMSQKIGVVDVGGGYRGIYAAGVLDDCLDNGIRFDLGIGRQCEYRVLHGGTGEAKQTILQ